MKPTGFLVMEWCKKYEQPLMLITGDALPPGGILDWGDGNKPRAIFPSREDARKAIDRTEHYRLAFGRPDLPEKKLCKVVPVAAVPSAKRVD